MGRRYSQEIRAEVLGKLRSGQKVSGLQRLMVSRRQRFVVGLNERRGHLLVKRAGIIPQWLHSDLTEFIKYPII